MFFWKRIGLLWTKEDFPNEGTCTSGSTVEPLTYKKLREAIAAIKRINPNPIIRVECSSAGYKELTNLLPAGPPAKSLLCCGPGVMLVEKKDQKEKYKIVRKVAA